MASKSFFEALAIRVLARIKVRCPSNIQRRSFGDPGGVCTTTRALAQGSEGTSKALQPISAGSPPFPFLEPPKVAVATQPTSQLQLFKEI